MLSDRAAYLADSARLRAFRLADGRALWETPATINHHKAPDLFLANGLVWAAAYSGSTGRTAPELGLNRMGVSGFEPESGKLVKRIDQTMLGLRVISCLTQSVRSTVSACNPLVASNCGHVALRGQQPGRLDVRKR